MVGKNQKISKLASFFFEVGTLRKVLRAHRQPLLTDDFSDNIASHSFRTTIIGWFLAKMEKADPHKLPRTDSQGFSLISLQSLAENPAVLCHYSGCRGRF